MPEEQFISIHKGPIAYTVECIANRKRDATHSFTEPLRITLCVCHSSIHQRPTICRRALCRWRPWSKTLWYVAQASLPACYVRWVTGPCMCVQESLKEKVGQLVSLPSSRLKLKVVSPGPSQGVTLKVRRSVNSQPMVRSVYMVCCVSIYV